MTYDTKCFDLAWTFVLDLKNEGVGMDHQDAENATHRLAQEIQKTIEDFIEEERRLRLKPVAVNRCVRCGDAIVSDRVDCELCRGFKDEPL